MEEGGGEVVRVVGVGKGEGVSCGHFYINIEEEEESPRFSCKIGFCGK